ncbi:MAG: 6-phosphofructokinase, partial [Candidatus Omnitrophota bacterium]
MGIKPNRAILVGLSGGDCAGVNPALAGIITEAAGLGLQAVTMDGGLQTLCAPKEIFIRGLTLRDSREKDFLIYLPTCIAGSSREKITEKNRKFALENAKDFYGVVLIGGDDHAKQSQDFAEYLQAEKIKLPVYIALKTVDNDTTAQPLGTYTAVHYQRRFFYATAITAWAHQKPSGVECMGRDRGCLLAEVGDIRIHPEDADIAWEITSTRESVIMLIPEKPAYLVDLLLEVLKRFSQEETTYNALLEPVKTRPMRLYANLLISEGYQFKDL